MKTKTFTVTHRKIRIKIKLLPTVVDVHRAYTGGTSVPRRVGSSVVHGFFAPSAQAKYIGTIVLPLNGSDLLETIPHEVAHAVIHAQNGVLSHDDEACCTAIGVLSAQIAKKIGGLHV
jgi:hypothetical protein